MFVKVFQYHFFISSSGNSCVIANAPRWHCFALCGSFKDFCVQFFYQTSDMRVEPGTADKEARMLPLCLAVSGQAKYASN